MEDFGISNIQDDDKVEITDLDPQNDGFSTSLSLVLLRLAQKIPLFADTRARSTSLALLACAFMLLSLVQPGSPDVPGRTSRTSALATSYAVDVQSQLHITDAPPAHNVTWNRISNGKVIVIQASAGTTAWHQCKVQRWSTPPRYSHPIVVICI
jgi:hypothetical protein